jgi:hypothetical protein
VSSGTDNSKAPPEIIATFPKPNYVNPETHGPGLMVASGLLSGVGIIVVGARLYARFCITKAPGIDDLLIILALIFGLTLSILVMLGNQIYYNGYHVWVRSTRCRPSMSSLISYTTNSH